MLHRKFGLYVCMAFLLSTTVYNSTNATATEQEETSYSSLQRNIEPWIARAERAEVGKSPGVAHDRLLMELNKASTVIDSYLESNPKDVQALILAARLGRSLEMVRPISVDSSSIKQIESQRRQRIEALQRLCDRALEVSPKNAEAYYWKAKLYGVRHFGIRKEKMTWVYVDLNKAIHFARRAVEFAPMISPYRETLAFYLAINDQRREAMQVMREVDDGQHLLYLVLDDREAVVLPPGSALLVEDTEYKIQQSIDRGWGVAYPHLQVEQHVMPMKAADAEAFFRRSWPTFQFFEFDKRDVNGSGTSYIQWLRWLNGKLQPAKKRADIPSQPQEGIAFILTEFEDMESHAPFPVSVKDIFSIITIRNYRQPSK